MENKLNTLRTLIDEKKNIIIGILAGVALLVAGYFIYKAFFISPKNKTAADQMFQAQFMFDKDSFQLALNNPGLGGSGFLKIIENYGNTPTGNIAKYYAGISYLQLNDFDKAIKYLEDYKPAGEITPAMTYVALGDAYSEKKNDDKALSYYQKAANNADNDLTGPYTLKKLGGFQEKLGKYADAANSYKKIMDNYGQTSDASNIEAFYERALIKANKK